MYLGIDVHKRYAQVAVMDAAGEIVEEVRVENANLDEAALGSELLEDYLLTGDEWMLHRVFDEIASRNVDDVGRELVDAASRNQLQTIAERKEGRDALRRIVQEVGDIFVWSDDADRETRLMDIITSAQPVAESEERDEASKGQQRAEVKVVTFHEGAGPFPSHTALIIGGYVYSFSTGWKCGQTEAEYKRENEWRSALVQVLDVAQSGVALIRYHLNQACGGGAFGFEGDCASQSGEYLATILEDFQGSWLPGQVAAELESSGHVKRRYRWDEGGGVSGTGSDSE